VTLTPILSQRADFAPHLVTGNREMAKNYQFPFLFFREGARGWVKKNADRTKKYFF